MPPVTDRIGVAFLGLGRMGRPMAARLLDAGYPLAVWNRTAERGADLARRGARLAATPAAAARGARVVITMLADPGAVEGVLAADDGVLAALDTGATVVDCSTVGPEHSRAFAALCADVGARFVDAPVMGSTAAAEQGTLTVLAGGDPAVVDAVEPVLRVLGRQVVRAGPTGSASALKLAMNLLVGGLTELLAEAFVLAEHAGVPKDVVRQTLAASVLASPFIGYKAPQLLDRQFSPLFTTELMLKDLNLVLDLARQTGAWLPATTVMRDQYARAAADGRGDRDFAAVIETVERTPAATP
jgi:3-hydroxyisobutyrate dehydrogenase-like beta-hydroxyacid dehydrogenase